MTVLRDAIARADGVVKTGGTVPVAGARTRAVRGRHCDREPRVLSTDDECKMALTVARCVWVLAEVE